MNVMHQEWSLPVPSYVSVPGICVFGDSVSLLHVTLCIISVFMVSCDGLGSHGGCIHFCTQFTWARLWILTRIKFLLKMNK